MLPEERRIREGLLFREERRWPSECRRKIAQFACGRGFLLTRSEEYFQLNFRAGLSSMGLKTKSHKISLKKLMSIWTKFTLLPQKGSYHILILVK